nr:7334_t:CDS:2 [Entrophospora candida]
MTNSKSDRHQFYFIFLEHYENEEKEAIVEKEEKEKMITISMYSDSEQEEPVKTSKLEHEPKLSTQSLIPNKMEDDNDELSVLEDDTKPPTKKRSTSNKKKDDKDIIDADELEDDPKSLIKKGSGQTTPNKKEDDNDGISELEEDPKPPTKKRYGQTKSSIPNKKNGIIDSGELGGLKDDPKPSMEKRSQKMMINPSRELAGCEDTKSQVRKLKEILVELG